MDTFNLDCCADGLVGCRCRWPLVVLAAAEQCTEVDGEPQSFQVTFTATGCCCAAAVMFFVMKKRMSLIGYITRLILSAIWFSILLIFVVGVPHVLEVMGFTSSYCCILRSLLLSLCKRIFCS